MRWYVGWLATASSTKPRWKHVCCLHRALNRFFFRRKWLLTSQEVLLHHISLIMYCSRPQRRVAPFLVYYAALLLVFTSKSGVLRRTSSLPSFLVAFVNFAASTALFLDGGVFALSWIWSNVSVWTSEPRGNHHKYQVHRFRSRESPSRVVPNTVLMSATVNTCWELVRTTVYT